MRMRRTVHQRRMMCLMILCVWSFATMLLLLKQIKNHNVYKNTRTSARRETTDYGFDGYSHWPDEERNKETSDQQLTHNNPQSENKNDESKDVDLQKMFEDLTNIPPTIKLRQKIKSQIDYGRDRDLDVEGVSDFMLWYENFQNNAPQLPTLPRQQKCKKPLQNIAFLKTHYTGSDVITNILNRYGDLNNLNIALPSDGLSSFFWPMRFQWKYIDITLLNGSLPNIISNHARYNNDVMDNILNPGSVYITILRDPITQLETTFNNLGFGGLLQVTNTSDQLKKFLQDPKFYIQGVIKRKRFKDTLNLIKNGQFFDLGLSTTEYHRKNIIKTTIQELYEKFTVVLIYEHLDESLLLMKRKLCWQLDDIIYLKFHYTNENIWNRKTMPSELADMIRQWNKADFSLYEFFNITLWDEISYEGESFWVELKEFKKLQNLMEKDCVGEMFPSSDDTFTLENIPTEKTPVNNEQNGILKGTDNRINIIRFLQYHHHKDALSYTLNNAGSGAGMSEILTQKILSDIKSQHRTLRDILMYTKVIKQNASTEITITRKQNVNSIDTEEPTESSSSQIVDNTLDRQTDPQQIVAAGEDMKSSRRPFMRRAYEENEAYSEGSGLYKPYTKETSNTERMLSKTASRWNTYLCKKLLMKELEYLSYFRRKHAYAKAATKR